MVVNDREAKHIAKIMCLWLPSEYALDMIQEIWNDVGKGTENVSLRDSILLLINYSNIIRVGSIMWGLLDYMLCMDPLL